MKKSGLKHKARSLAIARRQVREYVRREKNREGAVQELVNKRTFEARTAEEQAIRRANDMSMKLMKARHFEAWGLWDRIRFLFSPRSVVSGARYAA